MNSSGLLKSDQFNTNEFWSKQMGANYKIRNLLFNEPETFRIPLEH